jgi:hypothetical protein
MPRLRVSALVIVAGLCLTDGTAWAQKGYRPPPPPPRPISIPPPANNNRRPANDNRRVNTGTGRTPGASGGQAGQRLPRPRPQSTVRKPAPSGGNMPRMAGVNSARMGSPRLSQPVIAKPTVAQQMIIRNRLAAVRAKLDAADFRARLLQLKKAQDLAAMQRQKVANDQRVEKEKEEKDKKARLAAVPAAFSHEKGNTNSLRNIDPSSVGLKIANGHAFQKHQAELLAIGIRDQRTFSEVVQRTMQEATAENRKALTRGRVAYWNPSHNLVVIYDPERSDAGTAFVPKNGKTYFEQLK